MTNTLMSWLPRSTRASASAPRWRPSLTRLEDRDNPSGGLDLSFSLDGRQSLDFAANDQGRAVVVQPDGKVLVAGFTDAGNADFTVARYLPNGALDATFDGDGKQTVDFGAADFATGVAVQADGKIVLVGYTSLGASGVNINNFAVARLTTAGALDGTFDTDGKLAIDFGADDRASGVAVQADGKIVVAGSQLIGSSADFAFVRLTTTGGFDNSFDLDGRVAFPSGAEDVLTSVALQPDGKIVAAGYTNSSGTNDMMVMRLIGDGSPDPAFDTDGKQLVNFGGDDRANAVFVQADGKIVVAGSSDNGTADFAVARLNVNGSLDAGFSGDGRATFTFGSGASGQSEFATGVVQQKDGKLVVGGYTDNDVASGPNNFAVLRLRADGTLDTTFDADGKQQIDLGGDDRAYGLALQGDGRIVFAGSTTFGGSGANTHDLALARLIGRDTDLISREPSGTWWLNHTTGSAFAVTIATNWIEGGAWRDVLSGDVNGDGLTDLIGRTSEGRWWVSRNNGDGTFNFTHFGVWNEGAGWRDVTVADFNGDGRADVAGRTSDGSWWVAASTGNGFVNSLWANWNEGAGWRDVTVADFNGDGRADVAGRTSGGQWWVGVSTGSGFTTNPWTIWNEAAGWRDVCTGDFNGDGRDDVAGRTSDGSWWVGVSTGTGFVNTLWAGWNEAAGWRDVRVADFDGDGRDDVAGRTSDGSWWVAASTGTGFVNTLWTNWNEAAGWKDVRTGDFNGDGRDDVAARTAAGSWFVGTSTGTGFVNALWTSWNEAAGWKEVLTGTFVG